MTRSRLVAAGGALAALVGATVAGVATGSPTARAEAAASGTNAAATPNASGAIAFSHEVVVDEQRPGNEPDVKVDGSSGTIYTSVPFGFSTTQSFVWSSHDGGNSYGLVPGNIGPGKPTTCVGGGDTDLLVDPKGTLYFSDLQSLNNITNSVSSDQGKTWTTNCAGAPNTPVDRMWFGATGDLADKNLVLYQDYDGSGTSLSPSNPTGNQLVETESTDGTTFQPVVNSAPSVDCAGTNLANCVTDNEGISGNQVVDPKTGKVYIAHTTINGSGGTPGVQVSEGVVTQGTPPMATWTESPNLDAALCPDKTCVDSSGNAEEIAGVNFASIAEDSAGNLYVTFTAAPLKSGVRTAPDQVYVVSSTDGVNWSQPVAVGGPGENVYPWVTAGTDGRVDVAWYHSDETSEAGVYGPDNLNKAEWNVELAQSLDAHDAAPVYGVTPVTEHPIKYGPICTGGLNCTTGGDRSLGDFLQVTSDTSGAALVSFVDDTSQNVSGGEDTGPEVIARQISGPGLNAAVGNVSQGSGPGVPVDGVSDPAGDTFYANNGTVTPAGDNLDLTGASLSRQGQNLVATINVKSLSSLAPASGTGGSDAAWIIRWEQVTPGVAGNGHIYYAGMESSGGATPRFFDGDAGCVSTTHCKYLTYGGDRTISGGFDAKTGVITLTVPLSDIGTPSAGTQLYSATAFAATATASLSQFPLFNQTDATTPFDYKIPKPVVRVAGPDRVATSVAASQDAFPGNGTAGAVVLSRSDLFPDALAATPLASAKKAPLLLTPSDSLDPRTAAEINRVLPQGGTVFLVGGTDALSDNVANAVTAAGFKVVRYGGADRYATAVDIASSGLGSPRTVIIATGHDFADALSGGAAAAALQGAVLLSDGTVPSPATNAYLGTVPGATEYALGGPAATAYPSATPLVGSDRYATAAMAASRFFAGAKVAAVASGLSFPDALSGGADMAQRGGPVLLSDGTGLASSVTSYLTGDAANLTEGFLFGGTAVQSDNVLNELALAIS